MKRLLSLLLSAALLVPGSEAAAAAFQIRLAPPARVAGPRFVVPSLSRLGPGLTASALRPAPGLAKTSLLVSPSLQPAAALVQLQAGALALAEAPSVATVAGFFDGARVRPSPLTAGAWARPRRLEPKKEAAGPAKKDPPPNPRRTLARAFRVGLVAALAGWLLSGGILGIAAAAGHEFHSNYHYHHAAVADPLLRSLADMFKSSIIAPVAEEIVFRAGVMGGLTWITRRIPKVGRFWLPALLSTTLFVLAHETADPVLIGMRFAGDMILAYAYYKEGLAASMAMHGFHNLFCALPAFAAAAFGVALGSWGVAALAAPLAGFALWRLIAQQPEVAAGTLKPFRVSGLGAWGLSVFLIACYFLVVPNIYWLYGAAGWFLYTLWALVKRK